MLALLQAIFALSCVAKVAIAVDGEIDLLTAASWGTPARVTKCPKHAGFSVQRVASGLRLLPPAKLELFSIAEAQINAGVKIGGETVGLWMRLSADSPQTESSSWRIRVADSPKPAVRFQASVVIPGGDAATPFFIPWHAFPGQRLSRHGIDGCTNAGADCVLRPESITHISVLRSAGAASPALWFREFTVTTASALMGDGNATARVEVMLQDDVTMNAEQVGWRNSRQFSDIDKAVSAAGELLGRPRSSSIMSYLVCLFGFLTSITGEF